MSAPNGTTRVDVVGLSSAELAGVPDIQYRINPERWRFFDTSDPTKEYKINLTGAFVSVGASTALSSANTVQGPLAAYAVAASSTGVALSNLNPPVLLHGTQGFAEFLSLSTLKGVGYCVGSKVIAIGTATGDQNCWLYDKSAPGLWVKKTAAAINGGVGIFNTMFTTGSGVHLIAWAPNGGAGAQCLYRNTGDGVTWTKVIDSTLLQHPNDYIGSIDEDDSGNLMCTAYNGVDSTSGTGIAPTKGVFLSTDGGATWTNVYANVAVACDYSRHVHTIVWDRYRKCWWVSGGDGVNTTICYSKDSGATWTAWARSYQATVMIPTATAFIFNADISGYHDIIRIPAAANLGPEGVATQDPRSHIVFKLGTKRTPVAPLSGLAGDEFAFKAYQTRDGVLVISLGKSGTTGKCAYMLSSDDGATWSDGLGATAAASSVAATAGVTLFDWEPIRPSWRAAWDGKVYAYPNATTYVTRSVRVIPGGRRLEVNALTGDDISGDGINMPLASLDHPNLPVGTQLYQTSDLNADVVRLTAPGIIVDRNGFALGKTPIAKALAVNDNFEAFAGATTVSGTGVASGAQTGNAYADPFVATPGTKHGRCTITTANDTAILQWAGTLACADGDTVSMGAWVYVNMASITSTLTFFQIQSFINIGVQTTANGGGLQVTVVPQASAIFQQHSLDLVAMPLQSYFYLKVEVYRHPTRGWVKVYQGTLDGPQKIMRLALFVRDINTSGAYANLRMGVISGGQAGAQIDFDSVRAGINTDCEYVSPLVPPPYQLMNQGQHVFPDMASS